MSSEDNPDGEEPRVGSEHSALKDKLPEPHDEEPPPPVDEPEEEPSEQSAEEAWDEDYDEHVDAEDLPPPPTKKKKRKSGRIIAILVVLIILVLWTMLSPKMLPEVGSTYIDDTQHYASLGNYTGTRDIWTGKVTWGVSVNGTASTQVGTTVNLSVLITKVYEKPGNWFMRGTSIKLKNVSFYDENDTCVGVMSDWKNTKIGPVATVPVKFDQRGSFYLYAVIRFLVYEDMGIGFLPLETVEIPQAYLSVPIVVS